MPTKRILAVWKAETRDSNGSYTCLRIEFRDDCKLYLIRSGEKPRKWYEWLTNQPQFSRLNLAQKFLAASEELHRDRSYRDERYWVNHKCQTVFVDYDFIREASLPKEKPRAKPTFAFD